MLNANNGTGRRLEAINRAISTRSPVCSDLVELVQDSNKADRPSAILYHPMIYASPDGTQTVTGVAALAFSFDAIMNSSLPASTVNMIIVIRGAEATASLLMDRGLARYLGPGE